MVYEKFKHIIGVVVWLHPTEQERDAILLYNRHLDKVIIVDNSDTDNSALCADIENAVYLTHRNEHGIAGALNVGFREAERLGAQWVLTMDQDSQWNQSSLLDYITEAQQYTDFEHVGLFAPYHDCGEREDKHRQAHRFQALPIVMASGNLVRLQAWKEAQGFKEEFFIDYVDFEFDEHIQQLGWTVIRTNTITLTHHLGNGAKQLPFSHRTYTAHPAWRYFYRGRNALYMANLYPQRRSFYIQRLLKELKRLCLYDWTEKSAKLRQYIQGIRQGLQPRTYHLVLTDSYASLREEIRAIPSCFDNSGKVLYRARNEIRVIRLSNGLTLNVKRFRKPTFPNRLIYSFFRPSKAERAYRNAQRFAQLDLPTPEPVAYIEHKTPLLQESYLITLQSPLSRTFYEFRYHPVEGYEDIIRQFAHLMAQMHQKGVYHLDLSPGNILFDKDADGTIRFAFVDINRIRFANALSKKEACRNFCRLWGKMDFIEQLSREYAQARGWSYPETLHWITYYWKKFWHIKSQADIDRIFDPSLQRESF